MHPYGRKIRYGNRQPTQTLTHARSPMPRRKGKRHSERKAVPTRKHATDTRSLARLSSRRHALPMSAPSCTNVTAGLKLPAGLRNKCCWWKLGSATEVLSHSTGPRDGHVLALEATRRTRLISHGRALTGERPRAPAPPRAYAFCFFAGASASFAPSFCLKLASKFERMRPRMYSPAVIGSDCSGAMSACLSACMKKPIE
jgi:hypothetical protein